MLKKLSKNEKICTFIIIASLSLTIVVLKRELDFTRKNCNKAHTCNLEKSTPKISILPEDNTIKLIPGKPNLEYEKTRKRLKQTLLDFSFLVKNEIENLRLELQKNKTQCTERVSHGVKILTKLQNLYADFKYSMFYDLVTLKKVDGHDEWRMKEVNTLSDLIQTRFHVLQNPADCTRAKKMICKIYTVCGFGCELHHLMDCLLASYYSGRTLVLDSKDWRYSKGVGWTAAFLPISGTCGDATEYHTQSCSEFPGSNSQNMDFNYCNWIKGHAPFLTPNIPHDIFHRLNYVHDYPHIWWIGQLVKYLLRYNPTTIKMIEEMSKTINLQPPIATLHVRRTDKKYEAPYTPLSEYMKIIDEFYQHTKVASKQKKRVFLTTDDPLVVKEAKANFTNYDFLTDPIIAQLKPVYNYAGSNFNQTIFNLHFLARTSVMVCTLTSNLGRLALETAAHLNPDELPLFYSLDSIYTWPFGKSFYLEALIAHTATDGSEISLEVGDIIHQEDIQYNFNALQQRLGYLRGKNLRTDKFGIFPAFKVKLKPSKMESPNFKDGNVLFDQQP